MNELHLSIAGIPLRVQSATPMPDGFVGEKLAPFVAAGLTAPAQTGEVTITWRDADPRSLELGDLVFAPGSVWRMHSSPTGPDGGHVAVISYADEGRLTEHAAVLETDPSWTAVTLTELGKPAPWSSMLNLGAGELIVRTRIILEGGLVFHASAIDDSGCGVMMVGHAGAGKSTQASIWSAQPNVVALSDDRVAVRLVGGRATAFGTPWGGTAGIARNHSVPLKAILVLEQAPSNELARLSAEDAVPLLLARCFLPYWNPAMLGAAMDAMINILQAVPTYQFRCLPNDSVVPVVRSLM
ncbi:MAG: hypothetical protein FJX72_13280 [Armatimonadetes bacterium]|nr:hypothetical protein [Armatimonadota bacterium]